MELNYLLWGAVPGANPDAEIEGYEAKYPNATINYDSPVWTIPEYLQLQKVKLLSGTDLDLTAVRPETYVDYINAGYLAEITGEPYLDNYIPSMLDQVMVDGKAYGIPGAPSLIGVYYNKDIFSKLGLSIPTNWNEFLAVCQMIKDNDITPLMAGGKDGWPMEYDVWALIHDVFVNDPEIFAKIDSGEVKYTDKIWVDTFESINDFYKMGYVGKETVSMGYDQAITLFRQQNTAMLIQGAWASASVLGEEGSIPFEVGVFPIPHNAPGEETVSVVANGVMYCAVSTSKNLDYAKKYLEYVSTLEGATRSVKASFGFSSVKGAPSDYVLLGDQWGKFFEMKSITFFANLQYPAANAEMLKCLQLMFLGDMTPQEMADTLQAVQDKK